MQPFRQKVCLPFPGRTGWAGSSRACSAASIPQLSLSLSTESPSVWALPRCLWLCKRRLSLRGVLLLLRIQTSQLTVFSCWGNSALMADIAVWCKFCGLFIKNETRVWLEPGGVQVWLLILPEQEKKITISCTFYTCNFIVHNLRGRQPLSEWCSHWYTSSVL